ncbi:MAG: N-acetylmuramoyl-L-alanine amidase [Eubacteriales bacterium]|nr:N-acetylmuramoyl-L-alanine amidase [Eubacteriales bacterium]
MRIRKGKRLTAGALLALAVALAAVWGGGAVQAAAHRPASRTLVIDAGHGGFDGGATGAAGTGEQAINLCIAQRVQALAAFCGTRTVMTRTTEDALDYDPSRSVRENKVADIRARERLVAGIADPVFLSIHLNKFSDPQYHGAQVFYSPNHVDSRALAELVQDCLVRGCDPTNRRQARPAERTIYLMKQLDCPAAIVECGFLSNPAEEAQLRDPDHQKKLAAAIVTGYLRYANGSGWREYEAENSLSMQ